MPAILSLLLIFAALLFYLYRLIFDYPTTTAFRRYLVNWCCSYCHAAIFTVSPTDICCCCYNASYAVSLLAISCCYNVKYLVVLSNGCSCYYASYTVSLTEIYCCLTLATNIFNWRHILQLFRLNSSLLPDFAAFLYPYKPSPVTKRSVPDMSNTCAILPYNLSLDDAACKPTVTYPNRQ
jgi:hypothetical protein